MRDDDEVGLISAICKLLHLFKSCILERAICAECSLKGWFKSINRRYGNNAFNGVLADINAVILEHLLHLV